VKEAVVGDAMSWKRWMTRARGGADTIIKRRCHIRIVLTDSDN
jgi:ribosomal protein L22